MSLLNVYESTLSTIASLDHAAAEGARIRSRTRWAEEGEGSNSYFFRLEKRNGVEEWFSAMQNPDGSIVADVPGICDSWVSFYSDLFSVCPTNSDVQNQLLDNLSSFVPPSQVPLCEGHLTVEEAHKALSGMAKGKSPGSDGLPAEFYLAFWDILIPDLVEVLNASFDFGLFPFSQRGALISLIFKKGDRLLHKNWHPISLLNVDYKICARALAGRLLRVIHHVVARDQTCGVPLASLARMWPSRQLCQRCGSPACHLVFRPGEGFRPRPLALPPVYPLSNGFWPIFYQVGGVALL